MKTLHGSCLCGQVKFQAKAELRAFFFCHCTHCRKESGSAHGANLFASKFEFSWLQGEDAVSVYRHAGTRFAKSFCANCGSALPTMNVDHSMVAIPAGSLDCDVEIEPTGHIHVGSKANWDQDLEKAPHFDGPPQ